MKTTPKSNITFLQNPFSQTNIPNQNTKFRTAPKAQKQKNNSSIADRSFSSKSSTTKNSSATKNLEQPQKLTTKISNIQGKKHLLRLIQ